MADLERGENPGVLRWEAPTVNVDGSPINGPLSYNLYRSADESIDSGDLFYVVVGELQPDGSYEAPLNQMPEGRSVVALTAVDADGDESAFSNTMGFTVRIIPNPPVLVA